MPKRTGKVERTCKNCGTQWETWPSQPRQFCSHSCRMRYSVEQTGFKMPVKPRRGDTIPCDVCGKPVYRIPGEIAKDRRFCSKACAYSAQTRTPVTKHCPACGKEMRLKPSQSARIHCSRACETSKRILRPLDRMHNGRPAKLDQAGYVMVWEPTHPNKSMRGWQYEHRLVLEAIIGRYLTTEEQVDHINAVKDDNRPENLQILSATANLAKGRTDRLASIQSLRDELEEYRRRFGPLE